MLTVSADQQTLLPRWWDCECRRWDGPRRRPIRLRLRCRDGRTFRRVDWCSACRHPFDLV